MYFNKWFLGPEACAQRNAYNLVLQLNFYWYPTLQYHSIFLTVLHIARLTLNTKYTFHFSYHNNRNNNLHHKNTNLHVNRVIFSKTEQIIVGRQAFTRFLSWLLPGLRKMFI